MSPFLVFAIVILVMSLLIRYRVPTGIVLLVGATLLGLLANEGLGPTLLKVGQAGIAEATWRMILTVLAILILGSFLYETGLLDRLNRSFAGLIPSVRTRIILPPSLVGLLPMPGGAMLSAPMIVQSADRLGLSPEGRTVANYWFRHPWEYIFPLYPGIVIHATLLNLSFPMIALLQWPLTVGMLTVGVIFLRHEVPAQRDEVPAGESRRRGILQLFRSLWPVLTIVTLALGLHLPILPVIWGVLVLFVIIERPGWKIVRKSVVPHLDWQLVLIFWGVFAFQEVMSGAPFFDQLPALLALYHIPIPAILFLIPFIAGTLMGVTAAYIAVTYPLLMAILAPGGETVLAYVPLVYAGGFIGTMLSPVHLCLVLTREYYGASWAGIYRRMIPMAIGMSVVPFAVWWVISRFFHG